MRKMMTKAQQRLFQVNKVYDETHLGINNEYRRRYIQEARQMGLAIPSTLADHLNMPEEFHEAMKVHQKACIGSLMLAQEARHSSTRETSRRPRAR